MLVFTILLSCGNDEEEDTSSEDEPEDTQLNAPVIQTPSPLIHLADNLDEQDQLGWCIDTQGIGFNEALHTHSCKPDGGDVQFYYNEETGQICSVEYADFCIEMPGGPEQGMSLSLVESKRKAIFDPIGIGHTSREEILFATFRFSEGYFCFLLLYGFGLCGCTTTKARTYHHRSQWG